MDEWHRRVAVIRRESPVLQVDVDGFERFWALTRHADVAHSDVVTAAELVLFTELRAYLL